MPIENRLDCLLRILLDERASVQPLPQGRDEKWRLFRALVNVREPKPISAEFLAIQDELLRALTQEKGVTDIEDLIPTKDGICLWRGDITTLKAEAIVNAANSGLLGCFVPNHACIDNAIHTFAGVQLRLECAAIMEKQGRPEPTGRAKITQGYNLPSAHILHTVGPIIARRLTRRDCELLASCYRACLDLAEQRRLRSVAFCCISTGEFRFPNDAAARIAVDCVTRFIEERHSDIKVIFNVFKEVDYEIYARCLGEK